MSHAATSLTEVEKATARVLATRHERGNLKRAAGRLGMARMSLYKWLRARPPLPFRVYADDD